MVLAYKVTHADSAVRGALPLRLAPSSGASAEWAAWTEQTVERKRRRRAKCSAIDTGDAEAGADGREERDIGLGSLCVRISSLSLRDILCETLIDGDGEAMSSRESRNCTEEDAPLGGDGQSESCGEQGLGSSAQGEGVARSEGHSSEPGARTPRMRSPSTARQKARAVSESYGSNGSGIISGGGRNGKHSI